MKNRLSAFLMRKDRAAKLTKLRLVSLVVIAVVLAGLVFSFAPFGTAYAAGSYNVTTSSDTHDSNTGDGVCSDGTQCSLRAALEQANASGGTTTINLPSGTYNLSLGDLIVGTQANTTITIHGTGTPINTVVNQTQAGRMVFLVNFNVDANVVFNLDTVTVTGGSENELDPDGFGGNGGAILAGASTGNSVTITNVVFSGNYCSPSANDGCSGGAISMTGGGNLTVSNSTFSGNDAAKNKGTGSGGAIYFDNNSNPGNVSITNSIFTNNVAQGTGAQGGAVYLAGGVGSTYTVGNNTFTGNSAAQNGGALYLSKGSLTASFNRIVGNSSTSGSGLFVANNSGSIGTATNNWWGCNGGPGGTPCDTAVLGTPNQGGSMTVNPWIVLTNTASPNPIQVNQTTTLTADFLLNSANGSLTTGQISQLIGLPVSWGSAVKGSLTSSQATIQLNGTATSTFTASAAGAGSAVATVDSGAATVGITINKAGTTTVLTSETPDPSVTGQPVKVNYSVTSLTGNSPTAPTGNVTVSDGTDSCTDALAAGTCSIIITSAGSKSLTATYVGDSNFNSSTSSPATPHTVNPADTTTAITSDNPDPSVVGQSVTVQYDVAAVAPGSGTPTGSVTVSDGTVSCTGTVAAGQCSLTFTSAGAKTLAASYATDGNYNGSTSASASHQVNPADTTTTITSDNPDPSGIGEAVTVQYTVVAVAPGSGTPTGTVDVTDGVDSCTGTVATGQCSITLNTNGARTLTATYTGDTNYTTSTSAGVPHAVTGIATITIITSDTPDPSVVGQTVNVQYSVAPASGSGTPTGNVTVSDGTLSCTGTVATGQCSLTFLSAGARSLTATYAGDSNFNTSTSTLEAHQVNQADTTIAIISDNPDPSAGGQAVTVQYQVSVSSPGAGTPTGNVTVTDGLDSCTGTAAGGSCSIKLNTGGSRILFAAYLGDSNFNASTSAGEPHFVDNIPPAVTIDQASGQSDPTSTSPIHFTAIFSEPVTGFTSTGVSVSSTAGATTTTVTQVAPNDGTTYDVAVSGMSANGTVTATITAGVAQDGVGNLNTASTSTDNTVTFVFDSTPPNTTINSGPTNPTTSTSATFTFSGSDNITPAASLTFECKLDGGAFASCTSPISYSSLSLGSHTFQVRAIDAAHNVDPTPASFTWEIHATTSLLYNGGQIVAIGSTFTPAAKLSSPVAACTISQVISFALDINPLTGVTGAYPLGTATTNSSGQATLSSVNTTGWIENVYNIFASFAGTTSCAPSSDQATLTVASLGDSANGGGWYTLSGSGRVNFGFTVSKVDNNCTVNCTYKGQLLLINNGKWRLRGSLSSYVKLSTGQGAASGTGNLYWWDPTLNGGLGDWSLAQSGVSFTINFYDSGKTGKSSTDAFGINIQYTPVPPQPATLPNSSPTVLKGGDIKVK